MQALIYEPQFYGHHLAHVARLVRALAPLPCRVTLATSEQTFGSQEFQAHLAPLPEKVKAIPLGGFRLRTDGRAIDLQKLAGVHAAFRGLCQAIKRCQPDHVYVPHGNQLARYASLTGRLRRLLARTGAEAETLITGGRYTLPGETLPRRIVGKGYARLLASGPWTSIFHLDPLAVEHLQSTCPRLADVAKVSPEPSTASPLSKSAARRLLGLPESGQVVVIPGLIHLRKGVAELAEALRTLAIDQRLVLAGKCDAPSRALLDGQFADLVESGQLIALDRYLSEEEFQASLRAADVVAAYYPTHHYASSIVSYAAAAERPVLASGNGWIGRAARDNDLGIVCDSTSPADVAPALAEAFGLAPGFQLSPRGRHFARFNTEANFAAQWTARLRSRLSMPSAAELVPWGTMGWQSLAAA